MDLKWWVIRPRETLASVQMRSMVKPRMPSCARQARPASIKHFAAGFGGLAGEFGLGRGFLFYLGHGGVGGAIHDNAAPWLYFLEHGGIWKSVRQDDGLQIVIVNNNKRFKTDENKAT